MRRAPHSSTLGDEFGPGTDLVISLFAIMTCLFAFVVGENFNIKGLLSQAQDRLKDSDQFQREQQTAEQIVRDLRAQIAKLEGELNSTRQSLELLTGLKKEVEQLLQATEMRLAKKEIQLSSLLKKTEELDKSLLDAKEEIQRTTLHLAKVEADLASKNARIVALTKNQNELRGQLADATSDLASKSKALEEKQKEINELAARARKLIVGLEDLVQRQKDEIEDLKNLLAQRGDIEGKLRQEILDIKGPLQRVVFVVDGSGSMGNNTGRWEKARTLIQAWLQHLPVQNAALVIFNDEAYSYPSNRSFLVMNDANRQLLVAPFEKIKPEGGTATLKALRLAFSYENVDTIILFTDGKPDDGRTPTSTLVAQVLDFVEKQKTRGVVINTIGLGDYFKDGNRTNETFSLLLGLAEKTNGSFRGQ